MVQFELFRHVCRTKSIHLQTEEEGEAGQIHVALTVELACGVVGLGSDILDASVVSGSLALAHHLDHALDGVNKEDRNETVGKQRSRERSRQQSVAVARTRAKVSN